MGTAVFAAYSTVVTSALATRAATGAAASDAAEPFARWPCRANTATGTARATNGTFSHSSRRQPTRPARRSGHTSSSSSSAGAVIPVALASRLAAYSPTAAAYAARPPVRAWRTYAHAAPISSDPLSTSRRSVIQATDSTWTGWTTNRDATTAARAAAPVASASHRYSSTPAAACRATFSTCMARGSSPNAQASHRYETRLSGHHGPSSNDVHAHRQLAAVRPARTCGSSYTVLGSSNETNPNRRTGE